MEEEYTDRSEEEACRCTEGGDTELLSSLAVAFIVVVGLLVLGGVLLLAMARRMWRRRVAEAVEESRSGEGLLQTRELLETWEGRRRSLPPPYSPTKPPTPPPSYPSLPSPHQPSYQELVHLLHHHLLQQAPGAVHLLHLLQEDPAALARDLAASQGST